MANTTIETFVQLQSCMDCHGYYGVPMGPAAKRDYLQFGNLQIFTFFLQHAQYSTIPRAAASDDDLRHPVLKKEASKRGRRAGAG